MALANCGATPGRNETFGFNLGEIHFSNLCFNVLGGLSTDGARIGLWNDCFSLASNIKFSSNGPIQSLGQCMQMESFAGDGIRIGMRPCSGRTTGSEMWECYW